MVGCTWLGEGAAAVSRTGQACDRRTGGDSAASLRSPIPALSRWSDMGDYRDGAALYNGRRNDQLSSTGCARWTQVWKGAPVTQTPTWRAATKSRTVKIPSDRLVPNLPGWLLSTGTFCCKVGTCAGCTWAAATTGLRLCACCAQTLGCPPRWSDPPPLAVKSMTLQQPYYRWLSRLGLVAKMRYNRII